MNWLDGVLIALLVLGAILGMRQENFIVRLSHFLAVFTVLVFTATIFWVVLWIVDKIPFLNMVAGFLIGIGGPIVIAIIIAVMFYFILVKLYRDAAVYERIQSVLRWNPPTLINRLGSGLATSGIIAILLTMVIYIVTLFAVGGFFSSGSFSGANWNTIMTIADSALCRCSIPAFVWLFNWTGLVISIVLIIGYTFLLRRERSIVSSVLVTEPKASSSMIREYYENKMKSPPESSVSPGIDYQSQPSAEATVIAAAPIPPSPPLPPTTDAAKAQEYYDRAAELESVGNHEKAIEEYTKAIRLDSRHTLSYLKRGLLLKHMGMKPAAIADLRRVIDTTDNAELIEKANGYLTELG